MVNWQGFPPIQPIVLAIVVALTSCGAPPAPATPTPLLRLAEPTATPAAIASPPALPTSLPPSSIASESAQAPSELTAELDAFLDSLVQRGQFSGVVLVARGDQVVFNQGYGAADRERNIPNTPQTRYRLGSVTKPFTALAILMLQAQGRLDVQDPICQYIPDCPPAWQEITIHHLLTHTSGIPSLTELPDYQVTKATPSPPEQSIARFRNLPLEFRPGAAWKYSNSGYILLGYILEQASGQPYEVYLQEHIFDPLGMSNTGYDHNQDDLAVGYADVSSPAEFIDMSIPFAAGGLYSSAEDLYRWDRALFTRQLLPPESLDKMLTAYAFGTDQAGVGYGYGWYVGELFGRRWVGHPGRIEGFSAVNAWFPDDDVTIVVLMNQGDLSAFSVLEQIQGRVFGEH